jgi:hypothetical protein
MFHLRIALMGLLIFLPLSGLADVLFLDVNNNPIEIETARRAAAARGERLVVFPPPFSTQQANRMAQIDRQLQEINRQRASLFRGGRVDSRQQIDALSRQSFELFDERAKLGTELTDEGLRQTLSELNRNGTKLSSIIISGHDGNGSFTGSRGGISAANIQAALGEVPEMASGIRSLYLWGCYTTNYGSCEAHWKDVAPNLSILVGFDGSAPAQNKTANHTMLEDSMKLEKRLIEARDGREIANLWNQIRNINLVTASICLDDRIVSRQGVRDRRAMNAMCESLVREQKPRRWAERIACYRDGLPGCENPPQDTRTGELRAIYNEIQAHAHCRESLSADPNGAATELLACWPDPDEVIRLILYRQVAKNFSRFHRGEIAAHDRLIEELGFPSSLKLGDVTTLSRAELNRRLAGVQQELAKRTDSTAALVGPDGAKLSELALRSEKISATLGRVNPSCVDFSWVEPDPNGPSACMEPPSRQRIESQLSADFTARIMQEAIRPEEAARSKELLERSLSFVVQSGRASDDERQVLLAQMTEIQREMNGLEEVQRERYLTRLREELSAIRASHPNFADHPIYRRLSSEILDENRIPFGRVFGPNPFLQEERGSPAPMSTPLPSLDADQIDRLRRYREAR